MICDVKDEVVIQVSEFRVIICRCIELINFTHTQYQFPVALFKLKVLSSKLINLFVIHQSYQGKISRIDAHVEVKKFVRYMYGANFVVKLRVTQATSVFQGK